MVRSPPTPGAAAHAVPLALLCLSLLQTVAAISNKKCVKCPEGAEAIDDLCVVKGVGCGPRHRESGAVCMKRISSLGRLPHAICADGQESLWAKCYKLCPRNCYAHYDACMLSQRPYSVIKRTPLPPKRLVCPPRYWLSVDICRMACAAGFTWDGTTCIAKGCPPRTVAEGAYCRKPTVPCLKLVPR